MTHLRITTTFCIAALWVSSHIASANLITHSGVGVLQADHFEGDTLGAAPSSWDTTTGVTVRDSATNPPGSANKGLKFAALEAGDNLGETFTALGTGTLTTQFSFYMVNGTGADGHTRFRVRFLESDLLNIAGQIGFAPDTKTVEGTSLTFNTDEWTDVTMVVNLDAISTTDAISITVNGATETADLLNLNSIAGVNYTSRISGGPNVFIDGQAVVPEPGSLALFVLGTGLLCFYRKQQKL